MSTLGWRAVGDPVQRLCDAIEECKAQWGSDPAYKDVCFKLNQVEQELDVICASPGHRAALRAAGPNMAGQAPTERAEAPMEAQSASG
jgi:hypothetical protein